MDVADVMNGTADGVVQGGTPPNPILFPGHFFDVLNLHPVVKHFTDVVEQYRGSIDRSVLGFLLFDGVAFQPRHRPAPVGNKDQFCNVVFHIVLFAPR